MGRSTAFDSAALALAAGLACAVVPACAAPVCGSPNADGAMLCGVNAGIDQLARCNDGTIPVYWFRPGHDSGATHWVIWLEGGGQCIDQQTCAARASGGQRYLTSSGFTAGSGGGGVLSSNATTNPLLYNANAVLVHYCSSDMWSGGYASAGAFDPNDTSTWYFEGRRIAMAAVASLGLLDYDFQGATQIILGGSSSGGIGIAVTANDILPLLPPAQDIRLVEDAGFAMNIGQYDPAAPAPYIYPGRPNAFDALFEAGMATWRGSGDSVCAAAARTPADQVACYSSDVFQKGYIRLPSFVAESQLDMPQLSDELCPQQNGNCVLPHDAQSPQGQYATAFALSMATALAGGDGAAYSVFSPDSYLHVMMSSGAFTRPFSFPQGPLAPRDVFDAWLQGDGSQRVVALGDGPGVQAPTMPGMGLSK